MPDLQGHPAWVGRLQAERLRRQLEWVPAVAPQGCEGWFDRSHWDYPSQLPR